MNQALRQAAIFFLLILISLVLFRGAGRHSRLPEEENLIWENHAVAQGETIRAVQGQWESGGYRPQVRPVPTLARAVEHGIFDFERASYQTVQVLLHGVVGGLAFLLLLRWFGSLLLAALGGLLFATHPTTTHTVLYLGGLAEILCMIFFLGTLLAVQGLRGAADPKRRVAIGLLALLAMLSKEVGFLLPIVALGFPMRDRESGRRTAGWLAPVLLAAGIAILYRIVAVASLSEISRRVPVVDPTSALPFFSTVLQAIAGILTETVAVVVPIRLSHDYSWLLLLQGTGLYLRVALAILIVLGGVLLLVRRGGDSPRRLLVLIAFLPLVAPAVLPSITGTPASERNIYPALLGWVGLALLMGRKIADRWKSTPAILAGVGFGLVLLLGARTTVRVRDFESKDVLLQAADRAYPGNPQVLFELGNQRLARRDYAAAVPFYEEALKLRPDFSMASVNLGAAHIGQEEWGLALRALEPVAVRSKHVRALRLADAKAHYQAGIVLKNQKRYSEASLALERTLLFYPGHLLARANLGLIYIGAPHYVDRGLEHLRFVLARETDPDRRASLVKNIQKAQEMIGKYVEERGGTPSELESPGTGVLGEPWKAVAEEGM